MSTNLPKGKDVSSLYLELFHFIQKGEYDRAIKTCNKIMNIANTEQKAFHCKVVCLLEMNKVEEALQQINKYPEMSQNLHFEKSYCLYRLNKPEEALKVIESAPKMTKQLTEVKAQVLYRLEKYNDCCNMYRDLIKNSNDDYENERRTNLSAIMALLNLKTYFEQDFGKDSFEIMYNHAFQHIQDNNYAQAEKRLLECEKKARGTLEEEGLTEEEIEQEIALIRSQLAYCYHKQGRIKDAHNIYTQMMKLSRDDAGLFAVLSNNLVTINKDQNLFDSKKKMKSATHEGLDHKLNSVQRKHIAINNCLLLYYLNQTDNCRKQCQMVVQKWPDAWWYVAGLEAQILTRLGKTKEAIDYLVQKSKEQPENMLIYNMMVAQSYLMSNDKKAARDTLNDLGDYKYKPAIVSALVSLSNALEEPAEAAKVFEDTVAWYKKQQGSQGDLSAMWQKAAEYHMTHGNPVVAAESLEELLRSNPNDKRTIANLIMAYAKCDAKKAEIHSKKLPSVEQLTKEFNMDELENSITVAGIKALKTKYESSPGTPISGEVILKKQTSQKKRKRKHKYPPLTPDVRLDPERWLPKHERNGARKKKDRRGVKEQIKGSQGSAVSVISDSIDFSTKASEISSEPIMEEEPTKNIPSKMKGQGQKKKKKGGGRR